MLVGGIEAGGTKFVCAVTDGKNGIQERISMPTETPEQTLPRLFEYFDQFDHLDAIGLASFGPIDVNPKSKTYGAIMDTPKAGWEHYDILGAMKAHYPDTQFAFTTDVNAAAYGELKMGAADGLDSCVYLTVGTGIGGGVVEHGQILQGYSHPEIGHMLIRQQIEDSYEGTCPYHHNCLEGLAAGPAIERRWGKKGHLLPTDHQAWQMEADYLAQACVNIALMLSPERIVFGGGVSKQAQLFPMIRESFKRQMAGYVQTPDLDDYIVHVALGDDAGITGALLLAAELL